jgi:hypothetical protein
MLHVLESNLVLPADEASVVYQNGDAFIAARVGE